MSTYPGRGLHGQAVQELAHRIVSGTHAPGDLLDPEALEAELGMSRTVVREALKVLAAKGLVDARPRRGTFVRPREAWSLLDPDLLRWQFQSGGQAGFLDDLAELRQTVEPAAARLAASRGSEEARTALDASLAAMRAADGDRDAFIDADLSFHRALLWATGNELLARMEVVIETGLRARGRLVHGVLDWRDSVPAHAAVLAGVRQRDPTAAAAAMTELLAASDRDLARARRRAPGPAQQAP
ncbi:MAG TPA: FadR/GntR family transcriptional regulator [Acidimicrobiales bacterium]|nr:FadR/GntR family transcriptional regulator [Acidimicrobiales bacterium]